MTEASEDAEASGHAEVAENAGEGRSFQTDHEALAGQLYQALAEGDGDALRAILHPSFVGETTEGLPFGLGGRHIGPEAMAEDFWWRLGKHYRVRADPQHFLTLSDGGLVVLGRYVGIARGGGGSLDAAFAHVLRFTDRRISGVAQYTDSHRWVEALPSQPSGPRPLQAVDYGVESGVATIRLGRPDVGNAIDGALVDDFYEAVLRAGADPGVRAVLLCGAGRSLTVGGDLTMFAGLPPEELPDRLRRMTSIYHLALERLTALSAPVVCAVQGAVAGGGLGLVHVADIVVAADDSRFVLGYAGIGLASDGGNTWFLPRLVGMRRAQQLFFMNRALTAAEALDWGLVTEVVAADAVDGRAELITRQLASGPTAAFGRMKRLLRDSWSADLPAQLTAETEAMSEAGASADAREGVTAFVGKRTPKFEGG